jgi:hypothetical protein
MEGPSSYQRSSENSQLTWASSWSGHLHTMLKQIDKLRRPIRALSIWSRERSMSILGVGMKSYQRHCGHTMFRATEQQKLHLIT